MIDLSCVLNPALCGVGIARDAAIDAASNWWSSDDLAQTTVPSEPLPDYLYPDSPVPFPSSPSGAPPTSLATAAPPPPPAPSISPLWIGAGVVLLGLGGYYAYRTSR